ncbi:MAG: D-Ala-D-Ala carboxypeptidase family metallohydrolase [Elusimicrobiaceae bacterium]|nr:D-Ala-D-Ala carboxypeptidase family metallohydrolase [Elusimicrobiaceae bacterium]
MTEDFLLSPHFSFSELAASAGQPRLAAKNRLEAAAFADRLREVCEKLLEPVRERFGPVAVTSGYRCLALNTAVAGAKNSQHTRGEAADFTVPGVLPDEVFDWARASLPCFGQLIREPGWIHISLGQPYRPAHKCREALIFDGKNYRTIS